MMLRGARVESQCRGLRVESDPGLGRYYGLRREGCEHWTRTRSLTRGGGDISVMERRGTRGGADILAILAGRVEWKMGK